MSSLLDGISADAGNFSSKNGARLSLSIDGLAKAGTLQSKLVFYDANSGGIREHADVDWKIVSITHSRRGGRLQTFALGEDGEVIVVEKEQVWRNDIPRATFEDKRLGPMRKIRAAGDAVIAVGMNRQAYLLDENGRWENVSAPATGDNPVTGFEAVVGIGAEDFICAGWRGEIWRRHHGVWKQLDSPTNIVILDLVVGDRTIYGCGLGGLMIRGDAVAWEVIEQRPFDLDLYSVAWHAGKLYTASLYGVYELRDGKLFDVDYGFPPPETSHTLCTVADGMASIGAKDLLFLDDAGWKRLE
jgi:hypothetical protein